MSFFKLDDSFQNEIKDIHTLIAQAEEIVRENQNKIRETMAQKTVPASLLKNVQDVLRTETTVAQTNNSDDDDVIFVTQHSQNNNYQPTAIVDLCSPNTSSTEITNSRKRSKATASIGKDDLTSEKRRTTRSSLKSEPVESNNDSPARMKCPICMDYILNEKPTSTICGHIFCQKCIQQTVKLTKQCPICKKKLTNKSLLRLYF